MSANISPGELLNEMLKVASSRRKHSLEIINTVCEEQHARGSQDFSPVTIGKLSEKAGGPKERTIRNEEGKPYRALMHAWANFTGGVNKKPRVEKEPSIDSRILDRIIDPVVKSLVGQTMAENKKLKGELRLLKSTTNLTIDIRPHSKPIVNNGEEVAPPALDLLPSELEALRHAISKDFLNEQGWSVEENGRIKIKSRTIFKAGFATAINKILTLA